MIKRPLNPRFSEAVIAGRKITTIRDTAWPIGVPIMFYNWSGRAYRSKQSNVAQIEVLASSPIIITRKPDGMAYEVQFEWPLPALWETEGFNSQSDMDAWFSAILNAGEKTVKHIMHFRRRYPGLHSMDTLPKAEIERIGTVLQGAAL